MRWKDLIIVGVITISYILLLFIFRRNIFTFRFDRSLLKRYFVSQDIQHEVRGRLFLSDADVYLSTGYLYAMGSDPTEGNFEHPPFIKYLFGYSTRLFNNPYVVQIIFGILALFLLYLLGLKIYKNRLTSSFACLLLLIDPLFLDASSQTILDLGQMVFLLLYTYSILFHRKNFIFQGVALGLLSGSKFWAAPVFFVLIINAYLIYKKQFNIKQFIQALFIACITFSLLYLRTFIVRKGQFNIVFFQLKIFKYWLNHSVASMFGSSILLFTTGFFKSWWGNRDFMIGNIWFILWPVSLIISSFQGFKDFIMRKITITTVFAVTPFLYLIFLGVQAPFPRYFLIILPFLYLTLAYWYRRFLLK
ncbi:glycosyltransferase family 39 protein [Candidatus Roizmanbacteria bacterium]|nr:glycosyltransferase family 39 protein [Candidatus Roizmanbacteria bacterium]